MHNNPEKAIDSIREYLGESMFHNTETLIKNSRADRWQVVTICAKLGIEGYHVQAWADSLNVA